MLVKHGTKLLLIVVPFLVPMVLRFSLYQAMCMHLGVASQRSETEAAEAEQVVRAVLSGIATVGDSNMRSLRGRLS